jgi:hypothetical protein
MTKKPKPHALTLRLPKIERDGLELMAKTNGMTVTGVIRALIRTAMKKQGLDTEPDLLEKIFRSRGQKIPNKIP